MNKRLQEDNPNFVLYMYNNVEKIWTEKALFSVEKAIMHYI